MKVAFVSRSQRDHGTGLVSKCTNSRAVSLAAQPRDCEERPGISAFDPFDGPGRHAL
jgi:hypothetical protein